MANSKHITATKGRLESDLGNFVNSQLNKNGVYTKITKTVENSKASKGVITKFYPYLDKCEVKLNRNKKKVLCSVLHRFCGDLIDFFTPTGDEDYCTSLKEPCIVPREELEVFVLPVHVSDGTEWIMLGYFLSEELLEYNPASQGNFKIISIGGTNQYWIKFGHDGLDLRLPDTLSNVVGDFDDDMSDASSYTKDEVDDLIDGIEGATMSYDNGVLDFS